MFVCAGDSEQFDFATPIGIGMVDAAIRLTQLCMEHSPDEITFVGTAGSYGCKAIFDIIESHTAVNIENGFFDGKTYTPIDNWIEVPDKPSVSLDSSGSRKHEERRANDNSLSFAVSEPEWSERSEAMEAAPFQGLGAPLSSSSETLDCLRTEGSIEKNEKVSRETIINSSHYITTDVASAEQYLSNGIDLENMEFYAVLKVANSFDIPAKGIFIVTNYCNSDAHKDFIANHDEAKRHLNDYIRKHYA